VVTQHGVAVAAHVEHLRRLLHSDHEDISVAKYKL